MEDGTDNLLALLGLDIGEQLVEEEVVVEPRLETDVERIASLLEVNGDLLVKDYPLALAVSALRSGINGTVVQGCINRGQLNELSLAWYLKTEGVADENKPFSERVEKFVTALVESVRSVEDVDPELYVPIKQRFLPEDTREVDPLEQFLPRDPDKLLAAQRIVQEGGGLREVYCLRDLNVNMLVNGCAQLTENPQQVVEGAFAELNPRDTAIRALLLSQGHMEIGQRSLCVKKRTLGRI